MKTMRWLLVVLFAALPLFAQERNIRVGAFVSQVSTDEGELDENFDTEFEDGDGFGLTASMGFNKWLGFEAAIFSLRSESRLLFEGEAPVELGRVDLLPVMLGAQLHLTGGRRFDPYVGGGVAYVIANDLYSQDLDTLGIGSVDVDSEITYYLNAGIAFDVTPGFGLVLDGRMIPFEPETRGATGDAVEMDLSPTVLSAGLRFRF